jgi:SAM-dependent methyltransferase
VTARERANVFGEAADVYDRFRPGYPDALFDAVVAFGGLRTGDRALDVGIGTGLATPGFASRGLAVHGIEHDEAMAAIARAKGIDVDTIRFEDWTPTGDYALVYAAQAWHWLDPAVSYDRAADALAPGGTIALFWNRPEEFTGPLGADINAVYQQLAPELVDGSTTWHLEQWADRLDESGYFENAERQTFPWVERYSADQYTALMQTHSNHRMLPDAQREALHAAIHGVVVAHGGAVDVTYRADLFLSRRS